MPAALWQGERMAALGTVEEDEDFRWHIPEPKRRRYHRSSCTFAVKRLWRFSGSCISTIVYIKALFLQKLFNYSLDLFLSLEIKGYLIPIACWL
jgi:hypothetical protein